MPVYYLDITFFRTIIIYVSNNEFNQIFRNTTVNKTDAIFNVQMTFQIVYKVVLEIAVMRVLCEHTFRINKIITSNRIKKSRFKKNT